MTQVVNYSKGSMTVAFYNYSVNKSPSEEKFCIKITGKHMNFKERLYVILIHHQVIY